MNTFKNPQSILAAAKSDALGLAATTLSTAASGPNRNTLFNFPAAATTVMTNTTKSVNGMLQGVLKTPQTPP